MTQQVLSSASALVAYHNKSAGQQKSYITRAKPQRKGGENREKK